MTNLLLVGAGGFVGALARYLMSGWIHRVVPVAGFPLGTLSVNVMGCSLIGLVAGLAESRQLLGPESRSFLMIGLLGAFTTYSTFGYETLALARDAEILKAIANIGLHLVLGLAAVWLGGVAARAM